VDGVTFLVLVCPVLLDRGGGFYVAGVVSFNPYMACSLWYRRGL